VVWLVGWLVGWLLAGDCVLLLVCVLRCRVVSCAVVLDRGDVADSGKVVRCYFLLLLLLLVLVLVLVPVVLVQTLVVLVSG